MNTEELNKYAKEIESRPYLDYDESTSNDLETDLDDKELKKLQGKGFINRVTKYFRDKRQAKEIEKVDDLVDHIENSSVLDIIPEEYKEMMVNENGSTNKE